jgi:hypothetical protein
MATSSTVIGIKVKFELVTNDRLRKVMFGLEKTTVGNKVTWKITFELFERDKKTDPFGEHIVNVEVQVDKELHPKAEKIALAGMSAGQQAHALGPAADDQKAAEAGELSQSKADRTTQNTLKKK